MFFSWFVSGYAKDFPGTLSGTRSGKTRAGVPEPMNPRKQKRWGFPERRLHGKPHQECLRRRVTLPHPAGCSTITVPGLSFRVRKGTGRHTWAMATAKTTTDGPDPQRGPRPAKRENHPRAATGACRDGPGTGQRTRTPFRDHRNNAPCRQQSRSSKDADPPPHKSGEWDAMSPSPVSTGRLHPSRGFHLRPIKHVFHMRATGPRRAQGILISEQASRLDAFSGYPSRT